MWLEDEPIAWPSSVSLYYVSRLASEQVKVVLTGEGSDELFGGYARYGATLRNQRWMRWYGVAPARLETACENRLLRRACSPAKLAGRSSTLRSAARTAFSRSFSIISIARFPYQTYLDRWEQRASSSPLARMLFADQKTYLVELLMKQDQISMAASIESRVPFLDHPFVEFAAQVPDELKIRGRQANLLPADIIYRRKMGFPTPIPQWLPGDQAAGLFTLLRDPNSLLAAYANPSAVEQLIARHQ